MSDQHVRPPSPDHLVVHDLAAAAVAAETLRSWADHHAGPVPVATEYAQGLADGIAMTLRWALDAADRIELTARKYARQHAQTDSVTGTETEITIT